MFINLHSQPSLLGAWSLPEKAILNGASALLLAFFIFCGASLSGVEQASSQDLFINPAAASLILR